MTIGNAPTDQDFNVSPDARAIWPAGRWRRDRLPPVPLRFPMPLSSWIWIILPAGSTLPRSVPNGSFRTKNCPAAIIVKNSSLASIDLRHEPSTQVQRRSTYVKVVRPKSHSGSRDPCDGHLPPLQLTQQSNTPA